jgi:tetratricopeptide (TPR) repeat protein
MKSFFRILFVLFLCGLTIKTNAQNGVYFIPSEKQTDSMRAILYTTNNDTLKLCAYYYISSYYTELNKDSSLFYAEQQLQLANKINQQLWAADACFQIAYLAYGLGNYPKALNSVTNGLAITDDEASEKNNWHINIFSGDGIEKHARLFIASSLHQIFAFLYDNVDDSQKAIAEYIKAIKIAESVDNKEELSLDYMSLSGEYMSPDKYDSALLLENKAWVYAYQSNYPNLVSILYTTL